jgi:hypothetical protein
MDKPVETVEKTEGADKKKADKPKAKAAGKSAGKSKAAKPKAKAAGKTAKA